MSPQAKPAGTDCHHLCQDSCHIYKSRPGACAAFECAWLKCTRWPESWRPEKSGLLCLLETIDTGTPIAAVYEIRACAIIEPAAEAILLDLIRRCALVVVITLDQERRLLNGQWRVDRPAALAGPHFRLSQSRKAQRATTPALLPSLQGKVHHGDTEGTERL